MKNIDLQTIEANYELIFCSKVQKCIEIRKNLGITQSQIAFKLKKSLSTIQNFESFKCKDGFLIYAYKQLLS